MSALFNKFPTAHAFAPTPNVHHLARRQAENPQRTPRPTYQGRHRRIVAALGGNALFPRGQSSDHSPQVENARVAAEQLAHVVRLHDLVVTHGNGPQVGVLAAESSEDPRLSEPYPFATLVAQTQGMIGHWLVQGLQEALPHHNVVALTGRTEVRGDDPAVANPTKFICEVASPEDAE